jgi:hypothetical protein
MFKLLKLRHMNQIHRNFGTINLLIQDNPLEKSLRLKNEDFLHMSISAPAMWSYVGRSFWSEDLCQTEYPLNTKC